MKMLADFALTENIENLDEGMIREFLQHYSKHKGWSPKTFRNYRQAFSSFFTWCVKKGYVKKNPVQKIEKPKLPKRIPRSLTKEQTHTILGQTFWYQWNTPMGKSRNEAIITTFVYAGLRLQELLNLQTTDVDLRAREIIVREGKGRKDRIVPIHPRLAIALTGYIRDKQKAGNFNRWFFTGINSDKQLSPKDIHNICRKISKASGVYFTPHMLRHTFGRLAIDADLNIFKLKEIMGHSCVSTTQIYLSVSKEGVKRSFEKLKLL